MKKQKTTIVVASNETDGTAFGSQVLGSCELDWLGVIA